jgi:hypothetical protein
MQSRSTHQTFILFILAGGILLQLIPGRAHAQEPPNFVPNYQTVNVYNVNGHTMTSGGTDVNGTPLFTSLWKQGLIRLVDGRSFRAVPAQIDLEKQTVRYKQLDGSVQEIQPGLVSQVIILDTMGTVNVTFQFVSGYPPIDNQTMTNFYLLLDSGKVTFLESVRKRYIQEKNEYTTETNKEYRTYEDFYVFENGKMTRIKKDERFFLGLTNDKQSLMENFIKENKISFKSEESIRHFIHYYNGLP